MSNIGLLLTNVCNRACQFCFQAHGKPQPLFISDEDFASFLSWVVAHDIRIVTLAGGEPTLHPNFVGIVSALKERMEGVRVITNLLCGEPEALHGTTVLANADSLDQYSHAALDLFQHNLGVVAPRSSVVLAFTVWRQDQPADHLLEYCERFNVRHVRLDFARPSMVKDNQCIRFEELELFKPTLLSVARRLRAQAVELQFDCPIPVGFFTDAELSELSPKMLRSINPARPTPCSAVYVNPDLSIASCPYPRILDDLLPSFEDMDDLLEAVAFAKTYALQSAGDLSRLAYCEAERLPRAMHKPQA